LADHSAIEVSFDAVRLGRLVPSAETSKPIGAGRPSSVTRFSGSTAAKLTFDNAQGGKRWRFLTFGRTRAFVGLLEAA